MRIFASFTLLVITVTSCLDAQPRIVRANGVNAQTGTTYTYLTGDFGKLVTHSNGSAIAATLPQANGTTFPSGWFVEVQNIGAGTLTITPTTSTINVAATLVLTTGQGAKIVSNGTNYLAQLGKGGGAGGDALVANPLSQFAATTSAQLRGVLSDESGTGPAVFQGGALGTIASGDLGAGTGYLWSSLASRPFIKNAQTSTYQVLAADFDQCKTITVASGTFTITLVASGSQPVDGKCIQVLNYGTGVVTVARSGQNINGAAANLTMAAGSASVPTGLRVVSDGTNYFAQPFAASAACPTCVLTDAGATFGAFAYDFTAATVSLPAVFARTDIAQTDTAGATKTQVPSAALFGEIISAGKPTANTAGGRYTGVSGGLGWANGTAKMELSNPATADRVITLPDASVTMSYTVASGAKALATSAIASAACSSAQTDTATGTATTDTIIATFNGDPTAVTGYVPLTAGMLTIIAYPTSNTVNFKVCNNTSSSITPGAITLNWRVVR